MLEVKQPPLTQVENFAARRLVFGKAVLELDEGARARAFVHNHASAEELDDHVGLGPLIANRAQQQIVAIVVHVVRARAPVPPSTAPGARAQVCGLPAP